MIKIIVTCPGTNNNKSWYSATSWPAWPNTRAVSTPKTSSRTSRCSTTYRRRRNCWPTTTRSTARYSADWTACSNSWATSRKTAGNDWSARCTTIRPSSRRSATWCLHSSAGKSDKYTTAVQHFFKASFSCRDLWTSRFFSPPKVWEKCYFLLIIYFICTV